MGEGQDMYSEELRCQQGKAEAQLNPSIRKESWTLATQPLDALFIERNLRFGLRIEILALAVAVHLV
jgi:hypothetical protein